MQLIKTELDDFSDDIKRNIKEIRPNSGNQQPNGMTIEFTNGFCLSVQWGIGNYCDNHSYNFGNDLESIYSAYTKKLYSTNAEIAYYHKDDESDFRLIKFPDGDVVQGYQTVEEIIGHCRRIMAIEVESFGECEGCKKQNAHYKKQKKIYFSNNQWLCKYCKKRVSVGENC